MERLISFLTKCFKRDYYGEIRISFNAGKITCLEEIKKHNPADYVE